MTDEFNIEARARYVGHVIADDCPGITRHSIECDRLSQTVLAALELERRVTIKTLTTAIHKIAPREAEAIKDKYLEIQKKERELLEEFLKVLREQD